MNWMEGKLRRHGGPRGGGPWWLQGQEEGLQRGFAVHAGWGVGRGVGGAPLGSRGASPERRQEAGDGPQDGLPETETETRSCSRKPSPLSLLKRKCQHRLPLPPTA